MKNKTDLRKAAESRRKDLAAASRSFAARLAAHADALALPKGAVVSGYWAVREEADPCALMLALAAKGHPLALPRVTGRGMPLRFHLWQEGDAMRAGAFDIPEPLDSAETVTPAVLLVPLLAYDAQGHRLGYGGGFYDRTLHGLRAERAVFAIGIAYAGQQIPVLPHEAHDARLDAVLTERGLRRFTAQPDRA